MDLNPPAGRPIGTQLLILMIASALVPAAAIVALAGWSINQISQASQTGPSTGLPSQTLVLGVALGLAVLTVVVAMGSWLRMRALVRGQALELADLCRQITGGNRNLRAPVVGDDEFAVLAAAVNAVVDGAPMPGTANSLGLGEGQDAATLQAQIEKLLQEVSAVGDGDLRVQAEVTPDTLGVLADSFNYMIEELAKVVGRVQATTFQVTNATRRLLDRSAEVSNASEAQSVQISQTSEAVARLADFVQLSASSALSAVDAAREALRNAEGGQQAVVQTIDGMVHIRENVQETSKKIKRLGERSKEVGEIVGLIEDIAEQTNLLALNAAIQSAMAGEHGRGFSVVAEEIRLLAERVTEATKKIATIVTSIQGDTYEAVVAMEESTQEVVNGSRLADEAGEALRSIYSAVERQAQMIDNIARGANERAQTSEAVANAMIRIAEITRQTNSATQDTTSAVSYLAELAEQLRASVATFRLPEQQLAPGAGQSLLAAPDNAYAPMLALPTLNGSQGWGDEMQMGQLPALAGGSAGMVTSGALGSMGNMGNMGNNGYDMGGYDEYGNYGGYYNDQQRNGAPVPQRGQPEGQFRQGQETSYGGPPFPGDAY